jgi:hypothetical protein
MAQPLSDGGQGEAVRVPFADGTLVQLPKDTVSDPHLLSLLLHCPTSCPPATTRPWPWGSAPARRLPWSAAPSDRAVCLPI